MTWHRNTRGQYYGGRSESAPGPGVRRWPLIPGSIIGYVTTGHRVGNAYFSTRYLDREWAASFAQAVWILDIAYGVLRTLPTVASYAMSVSTARVGREVCTTLYHIMIAPSLIWYSHGQCQYGGCRSVFVGSYLNRMKPYGTAAAGTSIRQSLAPKTVQQHILELYAHATDGMPTRQTACSTAPTQDGTPA